MSLGAVLGGLQAVAGIGGLMKGDGGAGIAQARALRAQKNLTLEQIQLIKNLEPYLSAIQGQSMGLIGPLGQTAKDAAKYANSYDPAKQTEDLTRAYDVNARQSVNADLGNVSANSAIKGFTSGTGDSNLGGMYAQTLGGRAGQRAQYIGGLKSAEPFNKLNVLAQGQGALSGALGAFNPTAAITGASQSLQGPSTSLGNIAGQYGQQAANYDPTGSIANIAGGISKLFPKKQATQMPWDQKLGFSIPGMM